MDDLTLVRAERERRERRNRAELTPVWDWYGPDCGCPAAGRREDGSCPVHKRARPKQRPPEGDWILWYIETGRGWGKTETGAQWIQHKARTRPPRSQVILAAPTAADLRSVMVDGPSGILKVAEPWFYPEYQPSKSRLVWPNGTIGLLLSADEPKRFRGPQANDVWCDELAAWNYPEAFQMLMMGLRLGDNPQGCITTTPKPFDWLRRIKRQHGTVVVKGSTYENQANLAKSFFHTVIQPFIGTRLGRQELEAEDLEDTPGALWNTGLLDQLRIDRRDLPDAVRIVVAVDPSVADPTVATDESTAECGIAVGMMAHVDHPTLGTVPYGYLLADRSLKAHPKDWGEAVRNAYHEFKADMVVAEVNNGGALVATNIQTIDPSVPVRMLHASKGKHTRAEPVATMYQQRRVWHVRGEDFSQLESQLCSWLPGMKSPDRLDAAVWLFTELLLQGTPLDFGDSPWPDWRGT